MGVIILSIVSLAASGQTADRDPQQPAPPPNAATQAAPASPTAPPDPARQMEVDLNQMESLVNNMAAQVGFIRDTNMSILLNTNVRLWSVLIHDLRLQLQEQQRHAAPEKPNS